MDPRTNVSKVANFFFAAAFGLVVTAQWELSVGNGFAYTVFSAFGELPFLSFPDSEEERRGSVLTRMDRTVLRGLRRDPNPGFWRRRGVWG